MSDSFVTHGSSVHGISQARILEWVAFPFSGDLCDTRIKPMSSELASGFFTTDPSENPYYYFLMHICSKLQEVILGTLSFNEIIPLRA